MLGIPVRDHCYVYGDNQSVLCNTTIPDSTFKKKSQSQINLVIGTTYQVQGSKVNGTAAIEVRGETRKNHKVIIPAATFHVSRFGYRYVTDSTYSIHYEVFYLGS